MSVRLSVHKYSNSKFSALVLDRDLGVSRGHQSDYEDEDEEEEVKDNKDDNERVEEDNYQTIKCLTF